MFVLGLILPALLALLFKPKGRVAPEGPPVPISPLTASVKNPPLPRHPLDLPTARRLAPRVAEYIEKYQGAYPLEIVMAFQRAAGLVSKTTGKPDGLYGGRTAGALRAFGVEPPPAIYLPFEEIEYRMPL